MLRGTLRRSRRTFGQEDANPMEGAINIVDAMLVFACGLMLSLVLYWDVDLQKKEVLAVDQVQDTEEVAGIEDDLRSSIEGDGLYEKVGIVYVDPKTGKMYLVNEAEAGAGTDATDGASEAGGTNDEDTMP